MNRAIVMISDYGVQKIYVIESEKDIKKTFDQMIKKVKKEKKAPCNISTIQKEYFEEAGITLVDMPVIEYEDQMLVPDSLYEQGIEVACCRHCDSFDEGSCFRYGGICDPNKEMSECSRGHASDVKLLGYEDIDFEYDKYVYLETELSPEEIALALKETDENVRNIMESEHYDKSLWTLTKTD